MGDVGKRLCAEAGIGWLDLSGNACLSAPGLRVGIEGRPNLFKRPGRPRGVFASKSSRIVRWLLMEPARESTQHEIAKACGLDDGFTSRIVRRLEAERLVTRAATDAFKKETHRRNGVEETQNIGPDSTRKSDKIISKGAQGAGRVPGVDARTALNRAVGQCGPRVFQRNH